MRVERISERALILRDLPDAAWRLARSLNAHPMPGLEEAVPSYETIGLYFESPIADLSDIEKRLAGLNLADADQCAPRVHSIPVCYELGEDLSASARALLCTTEELIEQHLEGEYQCFAVGFTPGFAYLGYLSEGISGLPRLSSPRVRVEPGSVGITGRQTAVYPSSTPGGWNLIGCCPLELVNVEDGYFPIEAGDQVRFRRIDEQEFKNLLGERL